MTLVNTFVLQYLISLEAIVNAYYPVLTLLFYIGRTTTSPVAKSVTPLVSEIAQEAVLDITERIKKLASPQWKSFATKTTTANISTTEEVFVSLQQAVSMPLPLTTSANSINLTAATKTNGSNIYAKDKMWY